MKRRAAAFSCPAGARRDQALGGIRRARATALWLARRARRPGGAALIALAAVVLSVGSAPAANGTFSLDRLRLNPESRENYVFTAGNTIVPHGGADTGSYYRFVVRDAGGVVRNPSFPCLPAAAFGTADNSYTVSADDPVSTGSSWRYTLNQFSNSTCSGSPAKTATLRFYVARATAYADSGLRTPKTVFAPGQTAYIVVSGVRPSETRWSTTWLTPSQSSCANTAGGDRPEASQSGRLPKSGNTFLQYRPNTTGSAWNREANYEAKPCLDLAAPHDGTWTLRVELNSVNVVALNAFTLDATAPPPPTVDAGPPGVTNSASASFSFSDSEAGVTFLCRRDGAAFGTCTSPTTYSALADGSHTFEVKARDAAGNESPQTSWSWTVDTTAPPAPTIESAPASPTRSTTAAFEFADTEANVTFTCSLDAGEIGVCTSPRTYEGLPDGQHSFTVRGRDPAGNESSSTTHTWTVDTTAPSITLASPADGTSSGTPTPTFSGSAGTAAGDSATVTVEVHSGTSTTEPPVQTLTTTRTEDGAYSVDAAPLTPGTYSAHAEQHDAAGNVGASPVTTFTFGVGVPPVNTSAPTISGTARDGETLTADPGSWVATTPLTYAYQWRRCDAAGAACADIVGATSTTYTLAAADVGSTIRVVVTASSAGGSSTATSAETAVVSAAPPANTAPPAISGAPRDGETLTADPGSWAGTPPLAYDYQWRRCDSAGENCTDVAAATSSAYTLGAGDIDSTIRVAVTASNAAGSSTATSAETAVVTAAPPVNTSAPTISGTTQDGQTLTADPGAWSGTPPLTYDYQWRRCSSSGAPCVDVGDATASTYTLAAADVGATIRVAVTASNAGGSSTASSAETPVVTAAPPVNTSAPTISGTTQDGQTLTADPGAWSGTPPLAYAYQWRRCDSAGESCADIADATSSAYTLAAGDVASTIRVAVTASNAGGSSTATSAETAVVSAAAPVNTSAPTISGRTEDGHTLTAHPGAWTGTPPLSYAYQWGRCDSSGDGCVEIDAATGSQYTLASADVGSTIRITVTASNAAGSATATSGETAVVAAAVVAPANSSSPTVSGTVRDGQTLTADPGSWSGTEPLAYAYQWRRCGYNAVPLDQPAVYWRLGDASGTTAVDSSGNSRNGAYLGGVTLGAPGATAGDSNNAVSLDGNTGRVARNPFGPFPTTAISVEMWVKTTDTKASGLLSYATSASDNDLFIRTPSNLRINRGAANFSTGVAVDDGAWHHIVVTWRGSDGQTQVFKDGALAFTGTLATGTSITSGGSLVLGQDQDAVGGSFDPLQAYLGTLDEFSVYSGILTEAQVQAHFGGAANAGCRDIAGATSQTYVLGSADIAATIDVVVTASNAAGSSSATSTPTPAVQRAPVAPSNSSPPTIAGSARDGQTLTAATGLWTGTQPITYGYEWRRCSFSGVACATIAGATAQTYLLTDADVNSTIRVAVTAANAAGSATATSSATAPVASSAGNIGHRGPATTGAGIAPSGSKPESKLWWNDGFWWASMWSSTAAQFRIHRLDAGTQTWVDTGAIIDERSGTRTDTLWDGVHLYVASHVFSEAPAAGFPSRLYRYSYNAATDAYTLDFGFPATINNVRTETLVIDKDSTGTLWATWTQNNQVFVNRTTMSDSTWGTPFVLPGTGTSNLTPDDISSVIAFGGNRVGVMWSNQTNHAMYFAVHVDGEPDTTWRAAETALQGTSQVDDHISLRTDPTGRVFAAIKGSLDDIVNADPNWPLISLLVRDPTTGAWETHTVSRVAEGMTRPIVMVDEEHMAVHVFLNPVNSGVVYQKTASINSVSFAVGVGTTFINDAASPRLNNVTSTKQNVNSTTGLAVLATNDTTGFYWGNRVGLP